MTVIDSFPFAVFGSPQENAVEQMRELVWPNFKESGSRPDPRVRAAALMADHHLGYSMPIGGVVAYDNAVSPTGVGFDIACGNMAVKTNLEAFDLGTFHDRKNLMREIQKRIAFGVGRSNPTPIDHELFDSPAWLWLESVSPGLKHKAEQQLGTVGSGNHYVDILVDESSSVWVANHFGSRGLGHTIASGFMSLAAGVGFTDRVPEGEDAVLFAADSDLGQYYIECMELAGEYAYAGREYVIDQVLSLLGTTATETVHNHHNYAWKEDGLWVVRKGATPLSCKPAFIGGSMGDDSVIVRGSNVFGFKGKVVDIGALGSAPHGAGRVMSRTAAAGKLRKMWYCNNRNCDFEPERSIGTNTDYSRNCCPECDLPLRKGRMRDKSTAAIDWVGVRNELTERGIVVLGAGADESPGVYKNLGDVLGFHDNIEILHTLTPIGVVMAGSDEYDPYQD